MTSEIFLLAVLAAALATLGNWRLGMFLIISIGMLQDPLRKLIPGTPPLMAISALPVWLAMCASLYQSDRYFWQRFKRAYPRLGRTLRWFLVSLVPPIVLILGYGLGAWRLAVLGGFAYLAPLLTMVAGFNFARSDADVRRLLHFSAAAAAAMLLGSPLEYLDLAPDWAAVGTQALGATWVRSSEGQGAPFNLISGFFRSPDIMGWHAATLIMISATLAVTARRTAGRAWLALVPWGAFSLLVAGRRKMLMMPAIWLAFLLLVHLRAGRGRRLVATTAAVAIAVGSLYLAQGEGGIQVDYYAYAQRTITDAPSRFLQDTVGTVWFTVLQSGVLGRGIGSATQGGQHLGSGPGQSWQESGLGKLAVELGVPGLVCGLLLAAALARACYAALTRLPERSQGASLQAALIGAILANAASFVVSHQAYGDLLIATLTAFLLGIVLSAPRWTKAASEPDRPAVGHSKATLRPRPLEA